MHIRRNSKENLTSADTSAKAPSPLKDDVKEPDEDCLKLAEKYAEDSPIEGDEEQIADLARHIESAVSDWFNENT